jgi:hypothetical protein
MKITSPFSLTAKSLASTLALALSLALGGAVGCGGGASSFCSNLCECEGCSEEEEADCIDDYEDAVKEAEDEGCGDQVDEYTACVDSEFECRDGDADIDGCNSEAEAVSKCLR